MWTASRAWRSPRAAAAAGYDPDRLRRPGNTAGLFLHAENRKLSNDDQYLEPRHPEVLIFANAPGRPLVLIGVMFSVPRGVHGPTHPRWTDHTLAHSPSLRTGRAARPDAETRRFLPSWDSEPARSRDVAFLVHVRPSQRLRDPRARA